jgi:hypothetical protein
VLLVSVVVGGFQRIAQGRYWNIWCTPSDLAVYQQQPSGGVAWDTLSAYLDSLIPAFGTDFGFSFSPSTIAQSQDGNRFDLVLDPQSQGGAHTGTLFGPYGVSVSPDAVINELSGVRGFWFYLFSIHELSNVWAGHRANGWPWADGSPIWKGSSAFPNMTDVVMLGEVGRSDLSRIQQGRMSSDPGVTLLLSLQKSYGWPLYQSLFKLAADNGVSDWRSYQEPLRSAILVWFLSSAAGQTIGTGLLPQFNDMFQKLSGQVIPPDVYAKARSMFPQPAPPPSPSLWARLWAAIRSLLRR